MKTRGVLEQYQHMPSFSSIHADCQGIVEELRMKLREKFSNKEVNSPVRLQYAVRVSVVSVAERFQDAFSAYLFSKYDDVDRCSCCTGCDVESILEIDFLLSDCLL